MLVRASANGEKLFCCNAIAWINCISVNCLFRRRLRALNEKLDCAKSWFHAAFLRALAEINSDIAEAGDRFRTVSDRWDTAAPHRSGPTGSASRAPVHPAHPDPTHGPAWHHPGVPRRRGPDRRAAAAPGRPGDLVGVAHRRWSRDRPVWRSSQKPAHPQQDQGRQGSQCCSLQPDADPHERMVTQEIASNQVVIE